MLICWVENAIVIEDSEDLEEAIDELFNDDVYIDASMIDLDTMIQELQELKSKIDDIIMKLLQTTLGVHA